jgi:hypothetical protein
METHSVIEEPLAKMIYLIKRRDGATRDELIAHWFANHMPAVIANAHSRAAGGQLAARRYIASLFNPTAVGDVEWDGAAQLWWDRPLPLPDEPFGTEPTDTFQQQAKPYMPWATREYVVLDGGDRLKAEPLTLNEPFPTTRSGFYKLTVLITAKDGADHEAFFRHWLTTHASNVATVMQSHGGIRYTVSLSSDLANAPYAGAAELWFENEDAFDDYSNVIEPDGMAQWVANRIVLVTTTEMVGIP